MRLHRGWRVSLGHFLSLETIVDLFLIDLSSTKDLFLVCSIDLHRRFIFIW